MISIDIRDTSDLVPQLEEVLREKGITDGAIVSMIGAFDSCQISNMDKGDAFKDHIEAYDIPLEVSGSGYVENGKVHIHVVASSNKGETYAGHLHSASVFSWFIRLFVIE